MSISVAKIQNAFDYLFKSLHNPAFAKSFGFQHWNERELLPLVRAYLLGCFRQHMEPECWRDLPGSPSGWGVLDFIIGDIAVELAVRPRDKAKARVSRLQNKNEVRKLMKHKGRGLLVLFDFSSAPLTEEEVNSFRENLPRLGKGHRRSPFQLSYFYRTNTRPRRLEAQHMRIRV